MTTRPLTDAERHVLGPELRRRRRLQLELAEQDERIKRIIGALAGPSASVDPDAETMTVAGGEE